MFHDFQVFPAAGDRHYAEVFDPTTGQVRDSTLAYPTLAEAQHAGLRLCEALDAQRPARQRALALLTNERTAHA